MSKFNKITNRLAEVMFGKTMERITEIGVYGIGAMVLLYTLVVVLLMV